MLAFIGDDQQAQTRGLLGAEVGQQLFQGTAPGQLLSQRRHPAGGARIGPLGG
ncbi:hypothetical protein Vic_00061 [Mycolicibacterium phage Vic9]